MMIRIVQECTKLITVSFYRKEAAELKELPEGIQVLFRGEYLQTVWMEDAKGQLCLLVGMGESDADKINLKEIAARAAKECKERKIKEFAMDLGALTAEYGITSIRHMAEGVILGAYEQRQYKEKDEEKDAVEIELFGILSQNREEAETVLKESIAITEGVWFARDMVNLPGNKLRPKDFAEAVLAFVKDTRIEAEVIEASRLREMGMDALLGVGDSSEFPPCLLVLRYQGDPGSSRITGLIGKGVTCDTGGYCLKAAGSMLGIKGDMAGGAAVSGAIYALAKNEIKTNAVAVVPMCENRISPGSLLPGDVINSYAGKKIEIGNTDAEGRLILADAVSYAVREEKVSEILDIATLTGAVVNMLGFTVGGVICDDDSLFHSFKEAYETAGERYWRLPFYKEHEKMIESKIADIRNIGDKCCGTITAGLFIRSFAEKHPWIHLDIAGTAWVDAPIFEFQAAGATGAGVTSIYELCRGMKG